MIQFTGYITGTTEKMFWKKAGKLGRRILLITGVILLPVIVVFAYKLHSWFPILLYVVIMPTMLLCISLPKSEKERRAFNPKRIYIEQDYITCFTDQDEESRSIDEVKFVYEYEEFFDIQFYTKNASGKFLCQKDLLTHGTLSEFRKLFEEKIRREHSKGDSTD